MRTTLTLDDDLARRLRDEAHRRRTSFKQTVNDVLRRGLSPTLHARRKKYVPPVFTAELAPRVDPTRFNQLADDLEVLAVSQMR